MKDEWAEKEIEIALSKEDNYMEDIFKDYVRRCYDSALEAFKKFNSFSHSGGSWGLSRNILMRLLYDKPLSEIEDIEEEWNKTPIQMTNEDCVVYLSKRYNGLFKYVYSNGMIKFVDTARAKSIDQQGNTSITSFCNYVDVYFPIKLPYLPPLENFVVNIHKFYYDEDEYVNLINITSPENDRVIVNRFFKDNEEISMEEYEKAKKSYEKN